MNKTRAIKIIALIFFTFFISGFKPAKETYRDAPIDDAKLAFYLDFTQTGIYDEKPDEKQKSILQLSENLYSVCAKLNKPIDGVEAFLNKTVLSGHFEPHELLSYYKDPQNFVIILYGNFDINHFKKIIGSNKVNFDGVKNFTLIEMNLLKNQRLYMELDSSRIVICPENTTGNILFNLNNKISKTSKHLSTFANLFKAKPYISFEANFLKDSDTASIPLILLEAEHMRFVVSQKLSRLQLCIPDEEKLNNSVEQIKPIIAALAQMTDPESEFVAEIKNASLFVNHQNDGGDFSKAALHRASAFILQF
ncbi:MAG: hypothetical protein PHR62_15835, partial [Paludibacter sp.]|nr:hypothetical protein [Paludibacter sp.]